LDFPPDLSRLMPRSGKDLSKTRGEQTAIIFETLFWTPVVKIPAAQR